MRVAIRGNASWHHAVFGDALSAGLKKHGIQVDRFGPNDTYPAADIIAGWGWRSVGQAHSTGRTVLCMECGYVANEARFDWISLGFDGLNGRARFPAPQDTGERWKRLFKHHMAEWKTVRHGHAVVMGQVRGDCAIDGVDIVSWYRRTIAALKRRGWEVAYRPHPVEVEHGMTVPGLEPMVGSLSRALANADLVVTWNSNSAVDAVMAGVPAVAMDQPGSMAAPIAAENLEQTRPDRTEWAKAIAWKQWTKTEIENGDAWAALKTCAGL